MTPMGSEDSELEFNATFSSGFGNWLNDHSIPSPSQVTVVHAAIKGKLGHGIYQLYTFMIFMPCGVYYCTTGYWYMTRYIFPTKFMFLLC